MRRTLWDGERFEDVALHVIVFVVAAIAGLLWVVWP